MSWSSVCSSHATCLLINFQEDKMRLWWKKKRRRGVYFEGYTGRCFSSYLMHGEGRGEMIYGELSSPLTSFSEIMIVNWDPKPWLWCDRHFQWKARFCSQSSLCCCMGTEHHCKQNTEFGTETPHCRPCPKWLEISIIVHQKMSIY